MPEYLVRAKLEFGWDFQGESRRRRLRSPDTLPVTFGPFTLMHSPNAKFYLEELGWLEPDQTPASGPDWRFPISLLYVENRLRVSARTHSLAHADELLERLECLLRLYQPGEVSLRRHAHVWSLEQPEPRLALFFEAHPIKPDPASVYERAPYALDDVALDAFVAFFDVHWTVLAKTPRHLQAALARFTSSYERRTLDDRLTDLIVASEAVFGDGEGDSIAHKVAMRWACWLHPPGDERFAAFEAAKEMYSARSKLVHGGQPKGLTVERVDQLESMLRIALVRLLDHCRVTGTTPHGRDLDALIMTGEI